MQAECDSLSESLALQTQQNGQLKEQNQTLGLDVKRLEAAQARSERQVRDLEAEVRHREDGLQKQASFLAMIHDISAKASAAIGSANGNGHNGKIPATPASASARSLQSQGKKLS